MPPRHHFGVVRPEGDDERAAPNPVARLSPHCCQSHAGRRGTREGVPEMLGHTSPTVTLSIYAHVLPSMAAEADARLSAPLLG